MVLATDRYMMPSGRRWVLLVDDDFDACDMLGAIFEKRGVRARCLHSAAEAITLLDRLGQRRPRDFPRSVITDSADARDSAEPHSCDTSMRSDGCGTSASR